MPHVHSCLVLSKTEILLFQRSQVVNLRFKILRGGEQITRPWSTLI